MLIRRAEIWRRGLSDVRIERGVVAEMGRLDPRPGEDTLDAEGAALLPGLHDHHLHLTAFSVLRSSVLCGPPEVRNREELAARLSAPGDGWIRGVGYHESVVGMLDAAELDRMAPIRPVRLQHRSGRMWFLNTAALDILLRGAAPPPGLERAGAGFTGRLFDEDAWLKRALKSAPPSFAESSLALARCGVTGITDMSPENDPAAARHFRMEQARGDLRQPCTLAGALSLGEVVADERLRVGPAKLHLHEAQLPVETAAAFVRAAHDQGRPVAIHCASETELVFALSTVAEAGAARGDRIEHAAQAPAALVDEIARLGLAVCTQPHFIEERGDQYLADLPKGDWPGLYRLRTFLDAGVSLVGGSDAPFGGADPWATMRAAVRRQTSGGGIIGAGEALTPEQALQLFLADPADLSRERRIEIGEPADFCLLDRPWAAVRRRLLSSDVRMTFIAGEIVHDRIDETPAERGLRADALA